MKIVLFVPLLVGLLLGLMSTRASADFADYENSGNTV